MDAGGEARRDRSAVAWARIHARGMRFAALLAIALLPILAWAQVRADAAPATLRYANRDIVVFRASIGDATPSERVEQATRALDRMGDARRGGAVTLYPVELGGEPASAVLVGHQIVFTVRASDVAPAALPEQSERVRRNLELALQVLREQRRPQVLLRGIGIALAGAAAMVALWWVIARGAEWVEARLAALFTNIARKRQMRWREYARPLALRLMRLLRWSAYLLVFLCWLVVALEAFPLTNPLGGAAIAFVMDLLRDFARAIFLALPGLITVFVILVATRAVAEGVSLLLDNVQAGRIKVPFVHDDTAAATKRLVNIAVWGTGIALAYPHLPGSNTQVFKGLSVLFGLVLTLGTSGLVNQLMSGLVLIYSRALRRGDWVEVAGIEAEVVEVGGLATKLVNYNRNEITIPNSVMVGNSVRNYTKRAETDPVFLSVKVTIGYDAPWRLVHQLLLDAAAATPDLAPTPSAFILQRALGDFFVEYEVFAALADPRTTLPRKPSVLSAFNANIQDAFNSHDVQIMSPHFVLQPDSPVTVPKAKWFTDVRPDRGI